MLTLLTVSVSAQGFLSLSVVEDVGPEWVAALHDRCAEHSRARRKTSLFHEISAEISELLACPTVAGALRSLLGGDYLLAAGEFANDGLKLHSARPSDQGFHKVRLCCAGLCAGPAAATPNVRRLPGLTDCALLWQDGTDHGPTQCSVRDHRPSHLIPMLYPQVRADLQLRCCARRWCAQLRASPGHVGPQDTVIEMGPTSIIPGSNLLGVNREGFFHSEDRIRAELAAPQSLEEWTGAMREHPERDVGTAAADAERERSAVQALRSPGLVERKLCVKAGTIVCVTTSLLGFSAGLHFAQLTPSLRLLSQLHAP